MMIFKMYNKIIKWYS